MLAPKMEKEVRNFLGHLNYISWFISQLIVLCGLIFYLLKKKNLRVWDIYCEKAFDKIKRYLQNPSLIMSLISGRPLIIYLTMIKQS
jgi:hypothetical protein